jgi:uncharacterized protein (DUF433 family)
MPGLFAPSMQQLRERLRRAFRHLATIRELMDEAPGDFAGQRAAFEAMRGELAPFWALHEIRIGRAFLPVEPRSTHASIIDEWLSAIAAGLPIPEKAQSAAEPARARGQDFGAFCWPLAFPEVFFDADGKPLQNAGFSAVIGNPPWDKVKPDEREFFISFDPIIRDMQGQERKRRVAEIRRHPDIDAQWTKYASDQKAYVKALVNDVFEYQSVEIHGRKTGGDPDLYKFFLERFYQLVFSGGHVSLLIKGEFSNVEGCTGLRQLLFYHARLKTMFGFENFLRRFFPTVDSRQKFFAITFIKDEGGTQKFEAGFMLRNESWLMQPPERRDPPLLHLSRQVIEELTPELLIIPDFRSQAEIEVIRRIYRQFPRLGEHKEDAWNVSFTSEFHMTNDSYLFRDAARLKEMGAMLHGRRPSPTEAAAEAFFKQSDGGEFWTTPEAAWYDMQPERFARVERWVDSRGRIHLPGELLENRVKHRLTGYVLVHERDERTALPVRPSETYVPLYEGRMVHQFDHCQKAYISGSGRRAKWEELDWDEKEIVPHYFLSAREVLEHNSALNRLRGASCDVTGQTNERTCLASLVPSMHGCGHSINAVWSKESDDRSYLVWLCFANSFIFDFLARLQISNHASPYILRGLPVPRPGNGDAIWQELCTVAARLSYTTPELASLWEDIAHHYPEEFPLPWSRELASLDIRERAKLRAEIDARVAQLYGLTAHEYARILTTFPLLDQDQPPLPGDIFIRVTNKGEKVISRSYFTRDLALLTYCELMNEPPPTNIVAFFADAGVDIDRQTGPIRDLRERVEEATRRGAVAYIPSTRKSWSPEGPFLPPDLPLEIARNGHKEYHKWIVENPGILGGEPTLAGTRIAVRLVADLLDKGWTFRQIVESYPHLSNEQIAVAWRWSQL